ncbi:MAG: NADH dehydrogenase subunit, partial [Anaerolineales bacterium]|nr:NADH dehydrogenase subunit [Anaerolineales bacterium]
DGSDMPARVKARTPSLCNWATISDVAIGHKLADMPMLLVGIDPCFSCNDRSVTVTQPSGQREHWTWEQVRRFGIEYYQRQGGQ